MSTPVTLTYAPAAPGCCVRDCQDVIDLIQSSLSAALNVTFHGVLIQNNMPGPDERGNLWIETTSSNNCYFSAIKIWCDNCGPGCPDSGKWVQFTFPASSITAGDPCTLMGSSEVSGTDTVGHRTLSEVIDCIDDKQIPCSKIDFGIVPNGCTNHTWRITIRTNAAAVAAARIEFDVTWTSATCGVGRKFVTYSPISGTAGVEYVIDVCMPSDAASITVTNLKGVAVGGWTDTTVNCTPDTCTEITSLIPQYKATSGTVPNTNGTGAEFSWSHGFTGRPQSVQITFECDTAESGYVAGDVIHIWQVETTDADKVFAVKWDNTTVKVWGLQVGGSPAPTIAKIGEYDATADGEGTFTPGNWTLRVLAIYCPWLP